MQSKLIPVFIVAAIIQMAVVAGAVFAAQKLNDTNNDIQKSQEILYRATSMERSVLSANMSGTNMLSAMGGDTEEPSKAASAGSEDIYQTAMNELDQLEKLCSADPFYVEPIAKLKKVVGVTRKIGDKLRTEAAAAKAEGMTGMLKVVPTVRALYQVVDKLNERIDTVVKHETERKAQLLQTRDQYQQMQTVLLFTALVLSLGGAALIPAVMKR